MIQKWKTILTNWINCYSTEDETIQKSITPENLLNIFTHVHENFKLDDSKSSKFEATTIQDFVAEKYPEFKFENGNPDVSTEDEIYIAASLLLFFICVNSKNDDIKRVMCNKLDVGDQETILKFSKCLMECCPVLYADVEAAIKEACGQDVPGNQVAETPPPLRSLHGEVRRLQAALDAERFDRNYLQEELARTNSKLDRLTKDKEQYKLEILNLKAKISLCCGEQREASNEARADDPRLHHRQLQDLEERLVVTQTRLDDAIYERDTYKKKVDDLKQQRDKWLSLSQEEADRASRLADQLESERRTVQTLKDLVSELRQHNRNNGLDASLLECDDPDASIASLHNMSVCSEACANVVEVQLGEERAKIVVLKQQIQDLQDQLNNVTKKYDSEKHVLETIISEKDNDVSNLKQRVNAEIDDKRNLQSRYDLEVEDLNVRIQEFEQAIRDNEERSKHSLEEKIHEIESLQKKMADESKMSGNLIKNLKIELEAEKYAQLKLKDDYEDRIMKLNEKVLNRNNELVELQNNIIQKSEMIEVINSDLRKEKELRDELSNSCNDQLYKLNEQRIEIENTIQQKSLEIDECREQLHEKELRIDKMNEEFDKLHSIIKSLEEKCQHRESKIIEKQKEIEFLNDVYQKEQEKLTHKADERYATIKSLQMQLQNEIDYKVQLQNELAQLETSKTSLVNELEEVKCKSNAEIQEKVNMLDLLETHIKEENKLVEELNQNVLKHEQGLTQSNINIKSLEDQIDRQNKLWEEKIREKDDIIEDINNKLSIVIKEKAELQESINSLNAEKSAMVAAANAKHNDIAKLKTAYEKLCRDHHENKQNIKSLEANLKEEIKKNEQLQDSNEKDTSKLLLKLEKTEKAIKKIQTQSKSILDSKELYIQTLKMEITSLQKSIESEREVLNLNKKEKEVLEKNLREEVFFKNRLETEYQKKCKMLEETTNKLKEEIVLKNEEIDKLSQTIAVLEDDIKECKTKAETEHAAKVEMKEEFEKYVLELSEKESNNKKLLLNKMELILSDLKKATELKEELSKSYNNDLTMIKDEKKVLEESLQTKEQDNKELQKKLDHNIVLVQDLEKEVCNMKSFATKVEQECTNLKETNDKLLKQVENWGIHMENTRTQLKQLSNEKEKLSKTLIEKDIILESLEGQIQDELVLKAQVEEKNTELDILNKECLENAVKLEKKIIELNNQFSQKNNEVEVIKEHLQEKITNIQSLNTEIEQIRNNISIVTEQLNNSEKTKEQILKENLNRDEVIIELKNTILHLENKLTSERNNVNISLAETESVNSRLRNETEDKLKLQIEIAQIQAQNAELIEVNHKLLQEVSEMKCVVQEKDAVVQKVNEQLKEELARIAELTRNCDTKDAELNRIMEELALDNNKIEELTRSCDTNDAELNKIMEELAVNNNKIEELTHSCDTKDAELNRIMEQLALNNNNLTVLNNEMKSQESKALEKDNFIKDIYHKLESELSEKETLQLSLKSVNEMNAELSDTVKKYCDELMELKIKYENNISVLSEKENELLSVKNNLESESDHKAKLIADYDDKLDTLNHTVEELKQKIINGEQTSKIVLDKNIEEMRSLEIDITNEKAKFEKTLKVLEIEVDAGKISKLKMKEDFENHISKLNKKITNMSNELLELQNNVIENNQKTELLMSNLNKEKESKGELSKCLEKEILKSNEAKTIFQNDLLQKLDEYNALQDRLNDKMICIEQLNKEVDDLRSYCTDLQKDTRILGEAKTALLTVIEERDKKIEDYVKGETVLAILVENLQTLLKEVNEQMQNMDEITETTQSKLQTEISENTSLKAEHVQLTLDLSQKISEVTELKAENEKLLQISQKTVSIIKGLQAKLQENSMKVTEIQYTTDTEKSKILDNVNEMENIVINKNVEIQNLKDAMQQHQNELERLRESLITVQKDNEMLEDKMNNEVSLKNKLEKECENQRVMLNEITKKLKENVINQNNEATKMAQEIQTLRKTVEQKCEELKIAEENALKQSQTIADLKDVQSAEISSLKERVDSLQSFNDELEQELKNETDKNMQIIEALQKDNEQLQFIIEEDNSNHEIILKKKDDLIEAQDIKLKEVTLQLEAIQTDYEDKTLAWEKMKVETEEIMQAYVLKIEKLEEEKTILTKQVRALEEAKKERMTEETQENVLHMKHTSSENDAQASLNQVDSTTSDLTHSSMDSLKTISYLEKIVQDKNRKITALQTEITYLKTITAESGLKHTDVTRELELSRDTCEELSVQLKKLVQQKNEEIADLKRQVSKMSATENRASQIIKVSAKYQAMILKRIAEIKTTAVLKELTNFGNTNSSENELRRSLTAGSVTMEELENFLETTDRHLKRCSEKQIALQKDRDRLTEVNRINESEIINMKKFLTEMSVSFRTFSTVKEVYCQKLTKIVSIQRTVRRDILGMEGRVTEEAMCRLERGYAAAVQDLAEAAVALERWAARSVGRLLSPEKIKQAFTSELQPAALAAASYQNAAVEVQLSELERSFQKLLGEAARAQCGEGARPAHDVTVMEVRAEYEDKLNRMKAKMKELFHDEMARLKQKQSEEIAVLERELVKSREKLAESSRAYEEHIRALTTELWSVGEKFLVKQEEADWLRKKQSGSLMSLQHVHSGGLQGRSESIGRPSDTLSLRSLPMHGGKKSEGRGMHMSDEEGEVFDNRFLKDLSATPRAPAGQRLSELKRRNSLVPPHLKSSYPAEMQFATILDEEDIKCVSNTNFPGRQQRKEVGITAYKKPGPPTPSKQAGRLSATDSELRESLRVELDPQASRKTSTPSRLRSLFRSHRADGDEGTPRSRRFSNIFRKK